MPLRSRASLSRSRSISRLGSQARMGLARSGCCLSLVRGSHCFRGAMPQTVRNHESPKVLFVWYPSLNHAGPCAYPASRFSSIRGGVLCLGIGPPTDHPVRRYDRSCVLCRGALLSCRCCCSHSAECASVKVCSVRRCRPTMRSSGQRGQAMVFPDIPSARCRLTRR